ncbi:MAG: GatB/YqeY domain-containing protein [Abditibacteriaceae bacterium]
MSNLQIEITEAWKAAMKSGDTQRRDTLSTLRASIKNTEIDSKTPIGSLDDEAVQQVIEREGKKRRDAIEEYTKVDRVDLADREKVELEILAKYLPEPMSEAEVTAIVQSIIKETGASGMSAMGAVMKDALAKTAGRADGKLVSGIVRKELS